MLQVFVAISQKFCCKKRDMSYVKEKKKRVEKKMDTKVFEMFKTMGT